MSNQNTTTKQQTLKDLHANIKDLHLGYRDKVLSALGLNNVYSFYDILNGTRKLSPAEKKSIADIYGVDVADIQWNDTQTLPE